MLPTHGRDAAVREPLVAVEARRASVLIRILVRADPLSVGIVVAAVVVVAVIAGADGCRADRGSADAQAHATTIVVAAVTRGAPTAVPGDRLRDVGAVAAWA